MRPRAPGLTAVAGRPSTGRLVGPAQFEAALERAVGRARAGGQELAVGMLDVAELRRVNDLYGRCAGGEALRRAGERAAEGLAPAGGACRLPEHGFADLLGGPAQVLRLLARLAPRLSVAG